MKGSTRRPAKSDVVGILRGLAKRTPTSSSPRSSSATTMVNTAHRRRCRQARTSRSGGSLLSAASSRRPPSTPTDGRSNSTCCRRSAPFSSHGSRRRTSTPCTARLLESGRRNTSGHGPGLSAASVATYIASCTRRSPMLCAKAALCAIRLTGPTLRSGRPRRRPGLRSASGTQPSSRSFSARWSRSGWVARSCSPRIPECDEARSWGFDGRT